MIVKFFTVRAVGNFSIKYL